MLLDSSHSRPRYTKLIGSSDALALAEYAAQHSPLVVIAASALKIKGVSFAINFEHENRNEKILRC